MTRLRSLFLALGSLMVIGILSPFAANGQQPDLTISKCTFVPANPTPADPVTIQVEVKNQGNAQAVIPGGATQWIATKPTGGGVGPESKGDAIQPGGTVSNSLRLINPGELKPGTYEIIVKVDPENRVPESNKNNNQFTFRLTVTDSGSRAVQPASKPSLTSQVSSIRTESVFSVYGPNSVRVVPGGNPVTYVLQGKNLQNISSAAVIQNGRVVREIEVNLGPVVNSTQRQLTFRAKPEASLAGGYALQVVVSQKALTLPTSVLSLNVIRAEAMQGRLDQRAAMQEGKDKGLEGKTTEMQRKRPLEGPQSDKDGSKLQSGPGFIDPKTKEQNLQNELGRLQDPISKQVGIGKMPEAGPGKLGQQDKGTGLGGLPTQSDARKKGTGSDPGKGGPGDTRIMTGSTSGHVDVMTDQSDSGGGQNIGRTEYHFGVDGSTTTITTSHQGGRTYQSVHKRDKNGKVTESNSVDGKEVEAKKDEKPKDEKPKPEEPASTPHPEKGGGYSPSKIVVPGDPSRKMKEKLHTGQPLPVDPEREGSVSTRPASPAKPTKTGVKPSKGDIDPRPEGSSGTSSIPAPTGVSQPRLDIKKSLTDPGRPESGVTPKNVTIPGTEGPSKSNEPQAQGGASSGQTP